jgi:hypothetical protein
MTVPLPFTPVRLDLELPFVFLPTFLRVIAFFAALGLFVALVVRLYWAELRQVSPRAARVLLGLRVMAFAAVFVVLAGAPVVVRTVRESVPGRVLVAVDLSDSMRVTDPDRPIAEKLRLARALRLHDGVTADERIDEWLREAEQAGSPRYAPSGGVQRGLFEEVVARANGLTRVQAAERVLAPDGAGLLDRLKATHAAEVVGFAQGIAPLPSEPDQLPAALAARSPTAAFTDLKAPLVRAADRLGSSLIGVVLLTDGRHNWGEPPLAAARTLGERGVPIFAVNVAPRDPPSDIAVVAVRPVVAVAPRGSVVPVEVQLRVTRRPPGPVELELKFPDGRPSLTRTVRHDGTDQVHEVTFHPRLDRAGLQSFAVEARSDRPDHAPENDRRSARVNVTDSRPRVLLIDGEARWEFRYLLTALTQSREPPLEVRAVVFGQPRLGKGDDDEPGLPALKLPDEADALAGFDCVILGDATAEQLPTRDRERLEKYVSDAGGTLVISAGKRFLPLGLAGATPETDPLRKLLPIRNLTAFAPPEGFRPEFTEAGDRAWLLRLADSPEESRSIWRALPPHGWAAVGEPKDGAEVLARVPNQSPRRLGSPTVPDRPAALIARQNYGFGRVLYLGLDSTWRWRFLVGHDHHHRFWKQVVQWAAADRLLPTTNPAGTIRFGTREPVYPPGRDAEFLLRTTEAVPRLGPDATKAVRLVRLPAAEGEPESLVGTFPLAGPEDRPRELTARFSNLPPGRYAAEPGIPEWADHLRGPPGPDGRPGPLRSAFEVSPPEAEELADLTANLPLLEEMASASGGRVFEAAEVGELASLLAARSPVREYEVPTPLRRSWWTLALVTLLLTAEWVVRKVSGLA